MCGFWTQMTGSGRSLKLRTVNGKPLNYGVIQPCASRTQLWCLVYLAIKDMCYPLKDQRAWGSSGPALMASYPCKPLFLTAAKYALISRVRGSLPPSCRDLHLQPLYIQWRWLGGRFSSLVECSQSGQIQVQN